MNKIIPIILSALFATACVTNYAKEGYTSQADYQLAQQWEKQRPTQQGLDILKSKGISSKAQFDVAMSEMHASNYPTSEYKSEGMALLDYLSDKQFAENNNISITAARKKRTAQQQAEQARKEADEVKQKQQYAKEFPYILVISCGMAGRNINAFACFTNHGNITTELEVQNGSEYNMYKIHDISRAGNNTNDGLIIPLRNRFNVKAQNANDKLVLTFTVYDSATMREVYKKSAGMYGVVAISK